MSRIKRVLLQSIGPIHEKYRNQKIAAFLEIVNGGSPTGRLLDVGGGSGINREFLPMYARFKEAVVVNLQPQNLAQFERVRAKELVADGRELPFETGAFDWVFSNAVIEHVGQYEDQVRFANEIRRVAAKGYFVACPNKYFPIEPHTLLPFYQYLPRSVQRKVARHTPGYLKEYEEINLLTATQLRGLFPEATVRTLGFPVLGNNLVAYYRRVI